MSEHFPYTIDFVSTSWLLKCSVYLCSLQVRSSACFMQTGKPSFTTNWLYSLYLRQTIYREPHPSRGKDGQRGGLRALLRKEASRGWMTGHWIWWKLAGVGGHWDHNLVANSRTTQKRLKMVKSGRIVPDQPSLGIPHISSMLPRGPTLFLSQANVAERPWVYWKILIVGPPFWAH